MITRCRALLCEGKDFLMLSHMFVSLSSEPGPYFGMHGRVIAADSAVVHNGGSRADPKHLQETKTNTELENSITILSKTEHILP